ncbi:TonB-linked SusC/RagA family outer membrane protein [Lacibacter cauensis]|uniref:TonB-linked SusC/RagA family outer membrane protein n=1 Tax=Lacibacter cauensis TaxID=510947 RepID=A0A562SD40_9BACT|nr:TonB-dependent receptor [Lacibacter cauensis]TWI79202.1 TonB-linked SusC/RagA family outer membrane protein [Lacibacter cauensis]
MPNKTMNLPPLKRRAMHAVTLAMAMLLHFLLFSTSVTAQNLTVKGKVTGEDGSPVEGASVVVKGTTTGATTDNTGNFTISAARNAVLVISAINFADQEVRVTGTELTVKLVSIEKSLGEVVVIGYGTQRKKDITGSTVSLKGETLNEIKAPNIFNQLQGRAPGVDIVSNSSQIGAGGEIRIRGNRSLTGNNNPLIVVDGMVYGGSVNDINPDNIASLDILKDASATAIYGSRGSNGVIIITTKRGTVQKTTTTYNGFVGVVNAIGTYRLFNGEEYAKFKQDAREGQPNPANQNPYQLTADEQANLAAGVNTDWQNLLLTTGIRTSHDLGVRGGNERTQFYFGLGYYNETGIIHDQNLNRYTFNVNIDHKVSDRIKIGFTSFNTLLRSNRLGTNAYGAGTRLSPLYKPYNADGSLNFKPAIQQGVDNAQINPLTAIGNNDLIVAFNRRYQFQHNFYGEVKILKDLKFKTTFGYGWSQTFASNYNGPNTVFNINATTAGSTMSQSNAEGWQYTINNSLDYNKTFGGKHKVQALVLQEVQKNHFRAQQFNGQGIPADFMQDYNWLQVNTVNPQAGNFNESAVIGYMGRAVYSYDDRYLLTATMRTDGASVLAPGNQWVTYPAVSVGWNIANEKFMNDVDAISNLKLRAGWGISSNAGIGAYTTLGSLGNNFYNFGSGSTIGVNYVNGYLINTSPNPNLTWEKTTGINLGLDFGLFKNRISGSVDFYNNKTTDILLQRQLPRSNGVNSILVNAGETSSYGLEFSLSSVNIQSKNGFKWTTDFNGFFNKEKIVALQLGLKQDLGNGWFVGQPITTIFDYKKIGIWQTAEAAQAAVYGSAPGDIKIEDVNKDNVINAADRQIIGNFQPKLVAGLTNRFEFKNFDLNIVMFGRFGQTVVVNYLSADGGGAGYPFFLNSRVNQHKVDYWTPTNPTNAFPQPDASKDALLFTSTLTYRDGSFIKLRTIDLGYSFPSAKLKKVKIDGLRIYASAQNPFILWAPLVRDGLGIDPEGNGNGNAVGSQGGGVTPVPGRAITVGMGVPPTRQIIFGVNVRF